MPLYEYACPAHGTFDVMRPIRESQAAGACPECGGASARVITAPHVLTMSPIRRNAAERNERSRHEPRVSGSGCAHASPRTRASAKPADGRRPALQAYAGPRPWVVEHR